MSLIERMNELAETSDLTNVVSIVRTGNDEPPSSGFWLQDLEIGTIFLARAKPTSQNMKRSLELTEYGIFNKTVKCTLLFVRQPNGAIPIWVDTRSFSNEVEYFETLRTRDPQLMAMRAQIKEEEENDRNEAIAKHRTDTGSVQPDGLPDNAGHQV